MTVEHAVDDFMEALWEAVAIVALAVSPRQPGARARAPPCGPVDPARPRHRVRSHEEI